MFNRRSLLGALGAAPVAGAVMANEARNIGLSPYPEGAASQGSMLVGGAAPTPPRMERSAAMRMIFGDKSVVAEIRDELLAENAVISAVDPDIMVMKCWSPMAKITFQRQRNVERALAEIQDQRWDRPQ